MLRRRGRERRYRGGVLVQVRPHGPVAGRVLLFVRGRGRLLGELRSLVDEIVASRAEDDRVLTLLEIHLRA